MHYPIIIISKRNENLSILSRLLHSGVFAIRQTDVRVVGEFYEWLERYSGIAEYAPVYLVDGQTLQKYAKQKIKQEYAYDNFALVSTKETKYPGHAKLLIKSIGAVELTD